MAAVLPNVVAFDLLNPSGLRCQLLLTPAKRGATASRFNPFNTQHPRNGTLYWS